MSNPNLTDISERFARRLRAACGEAGYSANRLERVNELSIHLDLDRAVASTLLSGGALPNWEVLLKLCQLFGKEPGYFLDSKLAPLPDDTITAKSLTSGEKIVLRLPKVRRSLPADLSQNREEFRYFQSPSPMGFGVMGGDTLVNLEHQPRSDFAQANHHYLIGSDMGYELRFCVTNTSGRPILLADPRVNSLPDMIAPTDALPSGFHHFGQVQCLIRPKLLPI